MSAFPQSDLAHKSFQRRSVVTGLDLPKMFAAIDADPAIMGAGVVYIDKDFRATQLRAFQPVCRSKPISIILKEPPSDVDARAYARQLRSNSRESELVGELVGAGLSCAGAILGWIVVVTTTGVMPVTGGLSGAVAVVGVAAATASSVQCVNGAARIGMELGAPEWKDRLDSEEWYATTSTALDLVSLAGAGAATFSTIKMVQTLRATTGKSVREVLRGLNRQERRRLTEELARINYPGASNAVIKQMRRTGHFMSRYSNAQIQKATLLQIKDAASGALGFLGSAASGVVKGLAIAVYEEIDP